MAAERDRERGGEGKEATCNARVAARAKKRIKICPTWSKGTNDIVLASRSLWGQSMMAVPSPAAGVPITPIFMHPYTCHGVDIDTHAYCV